MTPRQSSNPKRRLAAPDALTPAERDALAGRALYVGSAMHKRSPGDYGFQPPSNPRPWKSLCDGKRTVARAEASALLRNGILNGFFSDCAGGTLPKYVWCVDDDGDVYEAKVDRNGYHGYLLDEDDDFRLLVLREWKRRCRPR